MTSLRLVAPTEKFTYDLLKQEVERNPGKNVWNSPASISVAFGMLLNAARTSTRAKLVNVLGLNYEDAATNNLAYANLISSMVDPSTGIELSTANSLWATKGLKFKRNFLTANRKSFGAKVAARDLVDPATLAEIQKFVFDNTGEKIKEFPKEISADAVLLIIQAVAYKAPWLVKFDKKMTRAGYWNMQREHDMMFLPNGAFNAYLPGLGRAGVMAFGTGPSRFNFVGILPEYGQKVEDVVRGLEVGTLRKIFDGMKPTQDGLVFPRFKIDVTTQLNDSLIALGLEEAFCQLADFTGMLSGKGPSPFISTVDHQAVAQFDENGSVGAAATKIETVLECAPQPVSFDKPFVGLIYDRSSGCVLKAGVVNDPEKITEETDWGNSEAAPQAEAAGEPEVGEYTPE